MIPTIKTRQLPAGSTRRLAAVRFVAGYNIDIILFVKRERERRTHSSYKVLETTKKISHFDPTSPSFHIAKKLNRYRYGTVGREREWEWESESNTNNNRKEAADQHLQSWLLTRSTLVPIVAAAAGIVVTVIIIIIIIIFMVFFFFFFFVVEYPQENCWVKGLLPPSRCGGSAVMWCDVMWCDVMWYYTPHVIDNYCSLEESGTQLPFVLMIHCTAQPSH